MKKFLAVFIVILALLLVSGRVFLVPFERDIEAGFIELAEEYIGADVKIKDFKLSIIKGELTLYDFVVKNPEGFESDYLLKINKIFLKVKPMSLMSEKIQVDEALFNDANVVYEEGVDGSNLDIIRENFMYVINKNQTDADDSEKKKKFVITNFEINNSKINIAKSLIPFGGKHEIEVPSIRLTNIGEGKGGVNLREAGRLIAVSIKKSLDGVAVKILFGSLINIVEDVVEAPIKVVDEVIKLPLDIIEAPFKLLKEIE